jgi:hypothetical protein
MNTVHVIFYATKVEKTVKSMNMHVLGKGLCVQFRREIDMKENYKK